MVNSPLSPGDGGVGSDIDRCISSQHCCYNKLMELIPCVQWIIYVVYHCVELKCTNIIYVQRQHTVEFVYMWYMYKGSEWCMSMCVC